MRATGKGAIVVLCEGTPCSEGFEVKGVGVLRLRRVMRFALDPASLRMTRWS